MKIYKIDKYTIKIEADNCLIIIKEKLLDRLNRPITSIQITPDKYTGEKKNIRVGGCNNIKVITLKKKNK